MPADSRRSTKSLSCHEEVTQLKLWPRCRSDVARFSIAISFPDTYPALQTNRTLTTLIPSSEELWPVAQPAMKRHSKTGRHLRYAILIEPNADRVRVMTGSQFSAKGNRAWAIVGFGQEIKSRDVRGHDGLENPV